MIFMEACLVDLVDWVFHHGNHAEGVWDGASLDTVEHGQSSPSARKSRKVRGGRADAARRRTTKTEVLAKEAVSQIY